MVDDKKYVMPELEENAVIGNEAAKAEIEKRFKKEGVEGLGIASTEIPWPTVV